MSVTDPMPSHRGHMPPVTVKVRFSVNGEPAEVDVEPRELLLDVVRDRLGLTGTHAGCEQGACGACTVLVDGRPIRSCATPIADVAAAQVTTLEGLGNPAQRSMVLPILKVTCIKQLFHEVEKASIVDLLAER